MAPTVRSSSADFEPLRLIAQRPERYPGLLESSAPAGASSGGGRFDILPIWCGETLLLDGAGRLSGRVAVGANGFLDALQRWWQDLELAGDASALPFTGGWLLYLGYELAAEVEPRLELPRAADPLTALALRTPAAWIRDRATGQAWVVAEPGHELLLVEFEADVRAWGAADEPVAGDAFTLEEEPPEHFSRAVEKALAYISAGDVYQANLSREWRGTFSRTIDPTALYRCLRLRNPSPFAAVLRYGDFSLMSSSPERLLAIRGGRVATRPIAGTRPRGSSPETDAALIESLLDNEKERAEHVMLIDLERNDLGRVCVGGSVQVDEFMGVETYAHVHHIVSNISGRLRDDVSPIDVIRALFPGGTITGCPKVRCMEIIAELEGTGRGAYTGSVGYLNRDGSCDLNILIRTITASGNAFKFRAGAGIVADSNFVQELAETRAKARGMLRAVDFSA